MVASSHNSQFIFLFQPLSTHAHPCTIILQITTKELGYFKLMGRPVMNGVLSAKQMLACVYSDPSREFVEVYVIDALTHHHQVPHSLTLYPPHTIYPHLYTPTHYTPSHYIPHTLYPPHIIPPSHYTPSHYIPHTLYPLTLYPPHTIPIHYTPLYNNR